MTGIAAMNLTIFSLHAELKVGSVTEIVKKTTEFWPCKNVDDEIDG